MKRFSCVQYCIRNDRIGIDNCSDRQGLFRSPGKFYDVQNLLVFCHHPANVRAVPILRVDFGDGVITLCYSHVRTMRKLCKLIFVEDVSSDAVLYANISYDVTAGIGLLHSNKFASAVAFVQTV